MRLLRTRIVTIWRAGVLGSAFVAASGCAEDRNPLAKRPVDDTPQGMARDVEFVEPGDDAGVDLDFDPLDGEEPDPTYDYADPRDNEPERDPALTLLHGVVDAEVLRFCVGTWDEQTQTGAINPTPWPSAGLQFGQQLALAPIDDDVTPLRGRLWVYTIASTARTVVDDTCAAAVRGVAGGPEFTNTDYELKLVDVEPAVGLQDAGVDAGVAPELADGGPDLPDQLEPADAGTVHDAGGDGGSSADASAPPQFTPPRTRVALTTLAAQPRDWSRLLVMTGCIGAPGLRAHLASFGAGRDYCGPSFATNDSTLTPVVVDLSRQRQFDSIGLQVVNASRAASRMTLRSNPGEAASGSFFVLARELAPGAVSPTAAAFEVKPDVLGIPLSDIVVDLLLDASLEPAWGAPWTDILTASNHPGLQAGRNTTLAVIGASPGAPVGPQLNGLAVRAVVNDPASER